MYLDYKNVVLSPFFWLFIEKCCTVTKKPKKPILQNLQGLPSLKVLANRFFCFSTALFNSRPTILGTVQHFCSFGLQKCCTVPIFWFFIEKCCTVPKKPKEPILQNLQGLPSLKVLENRFFRFFRDNTALLCLWTAKVLYCP